MWAKQDIPESKISTEKNGSKSSILHLLWIWNWGNQGGFHEGGRKQGGDWITG